MLSSPRFVSNEKGFMKDRILIIEGSSGHAREWAEAIACDDLSPEIASSALEAKNILQQNLLQNYRLLICDCSELTQNTISHLNAIRVVCDITILLCTRKTENQSELPLRHYQCIAMPFTAQDLLMRIRQLLLPPAPPAEPEVPLPSHFQIEVNPLYFTLHSS